MRLLIGIGALLLAVLAAAQGVSRIRRRRRPVYRRMQRRLSRFVAMWRPRASRGALIARIGAGSPAEQAGLRIGDIIVRFAGNRIGSSAELRKFVAAAIPGMRARLEVVRNGRRRSFMVTIASAENAARDGG